MENILSIEQKSLAAAIKIFNDEKDWVQRSETLIWKILRKVYETPSICKPSPT